MDRELTNMLARKGLEAAVKRGLKQGTLVGNPKQIQAAEELRKIDPANFIGSVSFTAVLDEEAGGFRVIGVIAGDEMVIQSLNILAHNAVEKSVEQVQRKPSLEDLLSAVFGAEVFGVDMGSGDETIILDEKEDNCQCPNCIARRQIVASMTDDERREAGLS